MKNLSRAVAVMGTLAGVSAMSSVLVMGCSGDDTDAGKDATSETTNEAQADNYVPPDGGTADVVDATTNDGPNTFLKFKTDLAVAFCGRFQNCCNGIDGGPFDNNLCVQAVTSGGIEGTNLDINPYVATSGNLAWDNMSAQTCISDLSTLSCPVVASMEWKTVVDACFKAIQGKVAANGLCTRSTECAPGDYCNYAVADAGTNDAGSPYGQCTAILALNAKCGQIPQYANTFSSVECQYRGWPPPARFCNYDSVTPANWFCDNLRTNGTVCYTDNECASGLCVDVTDAGTCDNNTCQCQGTKDFTGFCKSLKIKDAGPG